MTQDRLNVEKAVRDRYSGAAKQAEASLCCAVDYDPELLKVIPREVIEKDYGCGDPSKYVNKGETVLDLGSGAGKICFIAAQKVGPDGRVIGVDMNDDMLKIARSASDSIGQRLGFQNTKFFKGKIQDLRLNRDHVEGYLREHPIQTESDLRAYEIWAQDRMRSAPMIEDASVDVVVSNCVLNLVEEGAKTQMFDEIFRVLKKGGRAVISDIVADEDVPQRMKDDPELWSGCISGAFQECKFLRAFEKAGFYGVEILSRDQKPWKTIEGFEFRSMTVQAYKGKQGECWDHKEALIYRGPFQKVVDDDGHTFVRGERVAVCRKTFDIFSKAPYSASFDQVKPLKSVSKEEAKPFPCTGGILRRDPRETKGEDYNLTEVDSGGCC